MVLERRGTRIRDESTISIGDELREGVKTSPKLRDVINGRPLGVTS